MKEGWSSAAQIERGLAVFVVEVDVVEVIRVERSMVEADWAAGPFVGFPFASHPESTVDGGATLNCCLDHEVVGRRKVGGRGRHEDGFGDYAGAALRAR